MFIKFKEMLHFVAAPGTIDSVWERVVSEIKNLRAPYSLFASTSSAKTSEISQGY